MLTVNQLSFSYGNQPVLHDIAFSLSAGQVIGILGPNGCGKSTLLKLLAGLLLSDQGCIVFNQQMLALIDARERAKKISYLPQAAEVNWPLTVREVVALGRLPHLDVWQGLNAFDQALITQAMEQTDVVQLAENKISTLSSGERARVMLARMLATQADLLLADEPVANLDLYHQFHTMELLRDHAQRGGAVLCVMHDINLAARFCDQLVLLHRGKVLIAGKVSDVLTSDRIATAYGVECHLSLHEGYPHLIVQKRLNPQAH